MTVRDPCLQVCTQPVDLGQLVPRFAEPVDVLFAYMLGGAELLEVSPCLAVEVRVHIFRPA